jgi:NAD(P)-dependent dehydrogenase (short-subunit alcohol dehydrogenase family)
MKNSHAIITGGSSGIGREHTILTSVPRDADRPAL